MAQINIFNKPNPTKKYIVGEKRISGELTGYFWGFILGNDVGMNVKQVHGFRVDDIGKRYIVDEADILMSTDKKERVERFWEILTNNVEIKVEKLVKTKEVAYIRHRHTFVEAYDETLVDEMYHRYCKRMGRDFVEEYTEEKEFLTNIE